MSRFPRKRCVVCGSRFQRYHRADRYCSKGCKDFAHGSTSQRQEGEELIATRDAELARAAVRTCRERGLRKVHPQTASGQVKGAFYAPWRRSCGLYVIRIRWEER